MAAAFPATLSWLLMASPPASAIAGCGIDPTCLFSKGVSGAVSSIASDAITALAKAVLGALGKAVEWASTLWVGVGTPQIADASGQPSGTVAFLQHNLLYYATGLAVLSVLIGAGRIVYHEHKAAQARELARFLATYVLVSGAAAFAASVLVGGCDQMASWFIGQATANTSFADHLASLLGLGTAAASGATSNAAAGFTVGLAGTATTAVVAIVLGLIAFLAAVIQIVLMLVRATSAVAGGGAGGMLAGAAGGAGMLAMRMPTGAAPIQATPAAAYGQSQAAGPSGAAAAGGGPGGAMGPWSGSNGSRGGGSGSGGGAGRDGGPGASGAVGMPGAPGSGAGGGAG